MGKYINSILVPVDFSDNSDLAISKALELCPEGNNSTIYLFHTHRLFSSRVSRFLSRMVNGAGEKHDRFDMKNVARMLEGEKAKIEKMRNDIKVFYSVSIGGSVQGGIIKKARQLGAELIIIGKRSHHSLFPFLNTVIPGKLALATDVPVLTVKPGAFHERIKTVVIPICRQSPASKLEILAKLGNKSRPHVRLVIFEDDNTENSRSRQLLLYSFQMLKGRSYNMVNYEILKGGNKAMALLNYCNRVGADVLIVYPGAETKVGNWINSHISDLISSKSKTQVLAMTPG